MLRLNNRVTSWSRNKDIPKLLLTIFSDDVMGLRIRGCCVMSVVHIRRGRARKWSSEHIDFHASRKPGTNHISCASVSNRRGVCDGVLSWDCAASRALATSLSELWGSGDAGAVPLSHEVEGNHRHCGFNHLRRTTVTLCVFGLEVTDNLDALRTESS